MTDPRPRLAEIGARVIERSWGTVLLTARDQNTEARRRFLRSWFATDAGRIWRAERALRSAHEPTLAPKEGDPS
jgi:hypothetical protein